MLFIFSMPELFRNLWQLKTAVFLHWCLICAVPLNDLMKAIIAKKESRIEQYILDTNAGKLLS